MTRRNYADWGDHEILVEVATKTDRMDKQLTRLNGTVASDQQRLAVVETKIAERTRYGWPSKKHVIGGGTVLVVFATIAGTAIAKAIEFWPF